MSASSCIFCKIVAGEIPALRLFEEEGALAFLDACPLAEGHTLLIPTRHYERLENMPSEAVASLTRHLPRLGRAVTAATSAPGR